MVASDNKAKHPFAVDERLIMPETRYEVIDGHVVHVSPAPRALASRRAKLSALLEAYVTDGYDTACDMLTRTSEFGDMAFDGSIYAVAPDPETGGRRLEELAFEVVSTDTLAHAGVKAARLRARGARRVFAIDAEDKRALEWSSEAEVWQLLRNDDAIDDPTLVAPLPVAALVGKVPVDDAIVRALIAKKNPVLLAAIAEANALACAEGYTRGIAQALTSFLHARGFELTPDVVERIDACRDRALLERWVRRAVTATSLTSVFDD